MCNVNLATGEVTQFEVDVFLPGRVPFHLVRTYSSSSSAAGRFGYGWKCNLGMKIRAAGKGMELVPEDGPAVAFPLPAVSAELDDEAAGFRVARTRDEIALVESDLNRLVFAWSELRREPSPLLRKEDPYGNAIRYAYDERQRLQQVVDTAARTLLFEHDEYDRLLSVSLHLPGHDPDRHVLVAYRYDRHGDLVAVLDAAGQAKQYAYQDHLLVEIADRSGDHLYYQYDKQRRCVRTWRTDGIGYTDVRHDPLRRSVLTTNSLGYRTLYRNNEKGFTEVVVDPLGRVRQNVFDSQGKLLLNVSSSGAIMEVTRFDPATRTLVVSRNGTETTFVLDEQGKPLSITNCKGQTYRYQYDAGGQLTQSVSPTGAEWKFQYDARGDLTQAVNPMGYVVAKRRPDGRSLVVQDRHGVLGKWKFDRLGRMIWFEDGAGNRTEMFYDAAGFLERIVYADGSSVSYAYDGEGRFVSITDEIGRVTRHQYDSSGSPLEERLPDGSSEAFAFDTEERLCRLANAKGEVARFEYDPAGRVERIVYFDGLVEQYEYDDVNRVVAVRDGRGEPLFFLEYDAGPGPTCEPIPTARKSRSATGRWGRCFRWKTPPSPCNTPGTRKWTLPPSSRAAHGWSTATIAAAGGQP